MDNNEIDYKKAAEQLRNGEPLFGKDGALAPMLERILNAALEGEMDAHLSGEERSKGNRRNGKMPKQVQTRYGEVTIETPRDRDGSFEPETVKKRETILAEGMADQIISNVSSMNFGLTFYYLPHYVSIDPVKGFCDHIQQQMIISSYKH